MKLNGVNEMNYNIDQDEPTSSEVGSTEQSEQSQSRNGLYKNLAKWKQNFRVRPNFNALETEFQQKQVRVRKCEAELKKIDHQILGLKEAKVKIAGDLKYPEKVGYITREFVKCGKQTCRCVSGEGHGPYYYYNSSGERKTYLCSARKISTKYIELKAAIQNYKNNRSIHETMEEINQDILRLTRDRLLVEDRRTEAEQNVN